ncbi:MAG: class I SAM-dependent methyltransferase [Chloroflexota bacterium]
MSDDPQNLNDIGRDLWDQKAAFWDELHGDRGNHFHRELVEPAVERLLDVRPDERVLDVGCGSGVVARRLATLGAHVTAVDFSSRLIQRALARGQAGGAAIDYRVVDATDEVALAALGEGQYHAIVSTMALMDIPEIGPFYRAARRLLVPGGRLVVATAHPAFNSNNPTLVAESADQDGTLMWSTALKITEYLEIPPRLGMGAPREPVPHYYFHRPLGALFAEAFASGLVLDALEEPAFAPREPMRPGTWQSLSGIPQVLAARLIPRPGRSVAPAPDAQKLYE